jgi:cleavage and polyadenylation specificity factor subunit 1
LALTFDDAKLSIVQINQATMALHTLSLHSIEDDFLRDGYFKEIHHPTLRSDPDSRCCVFTVYNRHLAVVPLQKNRVTRKDERQILLQSYTIRMR